MRSDSLFSEKNDCKDDKIQALLFGLAVGDALGVPVEFRKRGTFHVEEMIGYGTYNQPPGTWSDDTSLALVLANNLSVNGINWPGLVQDSIEWRDMGKFTPFGVAFDIGNATRSAIDRLKIGVAPEESGGREEFDNGNGSLMRIAPLVFYLYDKSENERYEISLKVSSISHAHPVSIIACFIFIEFLRLLLLGRTKEQAYEELKVNFKKYDEFLDKNAFSRFHRLLDGDITRLDEKDIRSTGYVVDTLEASIWSFLTTGNYREAVLRAVNLGDDSDTTGCVTGAVAGLYYGLKSVPGNWLEELAKHDEILRIAKDLSRRLTAS